MHPTSLLKYSSALGWDIDTHCGKSITLIFPPFPPPYYSPCAIKLNSLKSPWIRPFSANLHTRSLLCTNNDLISVWLLMRCTWQSGDPGNNDISIACLLVSIGVGVGNPFLYSILMNPNYLTALSLDMYSQFHPFLSPTYYLFFFMLLNEFLPSLVSLSTII